MSVIIRLQNLPWSANSYDIRQYFSGLSIPEGGVHIVGGELGDAFIAFSTDEDARQAMMRSGGKLKEVQVSLLLSSRTEMQRVIEAARSAPPLVAAQPLPLPQLQPIPAPVVAVPPLRPVTDNTREPRKRSRSRSRDKSYQRSDYRDNGRRKRSRSRDRRDDRDRRRRRSRSRSAGRDRYGRDIEKREVFPRAKSKDRNDRSRDKHAEPARQSPKESHKKPAQPNATPSQTSVPPPSLNMPTIPLSGVAAPAANTNISNPFGLPTNLPFLDDRLTAAMKSTLSALNLPIPAKLDKPSVMTIATDSVRNIPPQMPQFDNTNNDVSRSHIGFPDPGPAFGLRPEAPFAFPPNFPQWANFNPNENANNSWQPKNNMPFPALNLQNNPGFGRIEPPAIRQSFPNSNDLNNVLPPPIMDDDFRPRFLDQGRFEQRSSNEPRESDYGNNSRFSNNQDAPRDSRNSRFDNDSYPPGRRNFERPELKDQQADRDRVRDNHDSDGRYDYHHQPRGGGGDKNYNRNNANSNTNVEWDDAFAELLNCPAVAYKEIRRSFSIAGYPLVDIRFVFENGIKKTFVKFANGESKINAMRSAKKIRVGSWVVTISHITVERYHSQSTARDNRDGSNDRSRWDDNNDSRRPRRRRSGSFNNANDDDDQYEPMYEKNEGNHNDKRDKEMMNVPIKPENGIKSAQSKMDCLFISNMPRTTTDRDVFDFFSDIGITPKKLHLMLGPDGEPSGEAYVEFWQREEATRACIKHGAPMGRSTVNVKLVEHSMVAEAVGLDSESRDLQEPTKKMEPTPLMPNLPRIVGPPQRLMDVSPGGGPPFSPRFSGPQPRFPPESRFANPRNGPPSPERVLVLYNLPYRAEVEEIVEFLGPFEITVDDIFRKMNERGQPTSEARVVMPTVEDALRAIDTIDSMPIRGRPITVKQLADNMA